MPNLFRHPTGQVATTISNKRLGLKRQRKSFGQKRTKPWPKASGIGHRKFLHAG